MAQLWSTNRGTWYNAPGFPPDEVGESQYGEHANTLIFPNIRSCTALAGASAQAGLCGIHLTSLDDDESIDRLFGRMGARLGRRAGTLVFFGSLNTTGTGCAQGSPYRWPEIGITARHLLAGGGGQVVGAPVRSSGTDLRVTLAGAAVTAEVRPTVVAGPAAPWTPLNLVTV